MKAYLVSFAVGALTGLIYGLLDVKSPAPPTLALIGLLSMLAGEHVLSFARTCIAHLAG